VLKLKKGDKMKVFAISDLHISTNTNKPMDVFGGNWVNYLETIKNDWQNKVSDEDIVLISGDISWAMTLDEAKPDFDVIKDLPGKKIIIRGNHDFWWSAISKVRDFLPENFIALQNDAVKIGNLVICGSRAWSVPGSPDFKEQDKKIYLREVERLKLSLSQGKKLLAEGDKLLVMVHYPPFNVKRENNLILDLFKEFDVDVVVYGHLHGKNVRADKFLQLDGIDYYLTSCDLVNNKLVEINLK
jgi:predicted phosphohydrolase